MKHRYWFLSAPSGSAWPVDDPVGWCALHCRPDATLAPARDDLLTLGTADADHTIRLVVRRCKLNLLDVQPERVIAHFWGGAGQADLRPFFKSMGMLREDVSVVLCERKHEVVTLTSGAEFLYGVKLSEKYLSETYQRKRRNLGMGESDDGCAAPHSWSTFVWAGVEPGFIPWAVLKALWRRDGAICPNCDGPLLVTAFGMAKIGMFNRTPRLVRICPPCRRSFEDDTVRSIEKWTAAHLDGPMLPGFERIWGRLVAWKPPNNR